MRMILITVLAIGSALAPALAQPPPTGGPVACNPIVAHVGSTFTITLPANRTTGYSWALEDPLAASVLAHRTKRYVQSTTGLAGAPGIEIWTFAAVGHGKALISMKYARPWEKSAPPAKEALYAVVVR